MKNFKKLFIVYGTLKKGYGNNRLLQNEHSKYLGECVTPPEYTLFDGGFPVVERGGETSIHGEVWEVSSPDVENSLNSLEGYSGVPHSSRNWYDVDENIPTPFGKASMYVMDEGKSGRNHILQSGKWK